MEISGRIDVSGGTLADKNGFHIHENDNCENPGSHWDEYDVRRLFNF